VLIDSSYQVIGHAYVKHSVSAIGHYINAVLLRLILSAEAMTSKGMCLRVMKGKGLFILS
jgi:hypothetical protein